MANAPVLGDKYMLVDPAIALTNPKNAAEQASAGLQNPAFAYAWDQNKGKLPGTWEGDNATIDAIFAIAQKYASPPATPALTTLSPSTNPAKSAAFLLTITGTGFTPGSTVIFGTVTEPRTTFVSPTTLTVLIYPSYIPLPGTIQLSVRPGGGAASSNQLPFTVT